MTARLQLHSQSSIFSDSIRDQLHLLACAWSCDSGCRESMDGTNPKTLSDYQCAWRRMGIARTWHCGWSARRWGARWRTTFTSATDLARAVDMERSCCRTSMSSRTCSCDSNCALALDHFRFDLQSSVECCRSRTACKNLATRLPRRGTNSFDWNNCCDSHRVESRNTLTWHSSRCTCDENGCDGAKRRWIGMHGETTQSANGGEVSIVAGHD